MLHLPATLARLEVENLDDRSNAGIGRSGDRREKSLGLLSQRFIQMFLVAPGDKVIALEEAAQMLLGTAPPLAWKQIMIGVYMTLSRLHRKSRRIG